VLAHARSRAARTRENYRLAGTARRLVSRARSRPGQQRTATGAGTGLPVVGTDRRGSRQQRDRPWSRSACASACPSGPPIRPPGAATCLPAGRCPAVRLRPPNGGCRAGERGSRRGSDSGSWVRSGVARSSAAHQSRSYDDQSRCRGAPLASATSAPTPDHDDGKL
jgi:hypothetical protein